MSADTHPRYRPRAPYPNVDGTQACANRDTDDYFPPPGKSAASVAAVQRIKASCRACPFRDPCLEYALDRPDLLGIWGAATAEDRKNMRRAMRRAA